MALQLNVVLKGHTSNYHRIIATTNSFKKDKVNVKVGLYKDLATRNANTDDHVRVTTYVFSLTPGVDKDRTALYTDLLDAQLREERESMKPLERSYHEKK